MIEPVTDYQTALLGTSDDFGKEDLEQVQAVLAALGFDTRIREVVDQPRPEDAALAHDMLSWLPQGAHVLETSAHAIIDVGATVATMRAAVRLVRDRRHQPRAQVDLDRAIVLARGRLWVVFGAELVGVAPVRRSQESDGSWTLTFVKDQDEYWATVPGQFDDLRLTGAVRVGAGPASSG